VDLALNISNTLLFLLYCKIEKPPPHTNLYVDRHNTSGWYRGQHCCQLLRHNPNVTLRTESERRTLSLSTVIEVFPQQVYGGEN
jgi:hypothetical protein